MFCGLFPIHIKLTRRRMDEQMPDSIPLSFREQREIAENAARTFIPGNQVKTVINEIRPGLCPVHRALLEDQAGEKQLQSSRLPLEPYRAQGQRDDDDAPDLD